jgi:hypothetical protein
VKREKQSSTMLTLVDMTKELAREVETMQGQLEIMARELAKLVVDVPPFVGEDPLTERGFTGGRTLAEEDVK